MNSDRMQMRPGAAEAGAKMCRSNVVGERGELRAI